MKVEFDRSFLKSLDKIKDKTLFPKIEQKIYLLENVSSLNEVTQLKKLAGYSNYYRIRIGDYRLGFEKINESTIRFIIIAHRKEIYRLFPG